MSDKLEKVEEKPKEMTAEELAQAKKEFEALLEKANDTTDRMIERGVYTLINQQPFVGYLVQQLARKKSLHLPTAGVAVENGKYTLYANPFFMASLTDAESVAILTHEVMHLLLEHLRRWEGLDKKIYNCAADLAINQFIPNLPSFDVNEAKQKLMKDGLSETEVDKALPKPDDKGRACSALLPKNYGLPNDKSSEWYYEKIMQDQDLKKQFEQKKVQINIGQGLTSLTKEEQEQLKKDIQEGRVKIEVGNDSHEDWKKTEGQTPEVLDEELRRLIREALDKSTSYGNLPGNIRESIEAFLTTKINWKTRLRSFIQRATHIVRNNSRTRPSRRYGVIFPGQKSDYKLNLGVFIDTSGSIGKEELELFAGEINRIYNTKLADITMFWGDTQLARKEKLLKPLKVESFKSYGGGGTDAKPWLEALDEEKVDAAVILTDGYFDHNLKAPKALIMWAITENGMKLDDIKIPFGRKVKLEIDKKRK